MLLYRYRHGITIAENHRPRVGGTIMNKTYDRRSQDVGNIVALEHVNVKIPDQVIATAFYVQGLGFTRDPYIMVGVENMWINLGQEQFHLPTGDPQVLRGHVGMVVPDLEALKARLESVRPKLAGTKFDFAAEDKHVRVTCPWGNTLRCHAAGPEWGDATLGMAYVEFPVPAGHADGIKRFYEKVFGAPASVAPESRGDGGAREDRLAGRNWSSARPRGRSRPTTAITSPSTS